MKMISKLLSKYGNRKYSSFLVLITKETATAIHKTILGSLKVATASILLSKSSFGGHASESLKYALLEHNLGDVMLTLSGSRAAR